MENPRRPLRPERRAVPDLVSFNSTHLFRSAFVLSAILLVAVRPVLADPSFPVPSLDQSSVTLNSGFHVESTETAAPFSHHVRTDFGYSVPVSLSGDASRFRLDGALGFGLPGRLELNLGLSGSAVFGNMEMNASATPSEGVSFGDLRTSLLWNARRVSDGGVGVLFGSHLFFPTGANDRLSGEGGVVAEPFVSVALQLLSARFLVNVGYRLRPEHQLELSDGSVFEQDDDLLWRLAFRIAREEDVAWSLEADGAIGVATSEGFWPSSASRPVWLGAGIDFPINRKDRIGIAAGFGVAGETVSAFSMNLRFLFGEPIPDEDHDGVSATQDQCPLLPEDRDGFDDHDGCPDLDNDRDGFPDREDRCPLQPADDFSEDGCPSGVAGQPAL